jgi:hypothetical protein
MGAICRFGMACAIAIGVMPLSAHAQTARSEEVAAVLTQLLEAQGLDVIAAPDPDVRGRFIAALYLKGSQLLVVDGEYPVPVLLEQRLQRGEYREAYMDLQGASRPATKVFIHDMQANGLQQTPGSGEPSDTVFDNGTRQTLFNGEWSGQHLSEAEYRARFAEADARYARMLSRLVAVLKART